ncbi:MULTISPECIES: hypothetical protein [Corynebacterium]|uniref:Uncharacterized protein n=1 Tax=Corynebacterium provencense TaxID=1737425 RepID=A0A2Z3YNV7_9CORY|nr:MULTISPECIES: hypothetical protein [Corynebacterium]AWT26302.1 hypothetical protein Csp1_15140 [Corynebacterium provencense]
MAVTGPLPGEGQFDAEALTAEVDALLASDATGAQEAELLEKAHRIIADALEGQSGRTVRNP